MNKKMILLLTTILLALLVLSGCAAAAASESSQAAAATLADGGEVWNTFVEEATGGETVVAVAETAALETAAVEPAATATAVRQIDVATPAAVDVDAEAATAITLNGDSISAGGQGVSIDGRTATITAAGTYTLSGTLAEGQILVDTAGEGAVTLILDGVTIHNSSGAALAVLNADQAVVVLAEGSENMLSDGDAYVFPDLEEDEPNATLFSKDDLLITGGGTLVVNGNYNDGIAGKDTVTVSGGTLIVTAVDDGLRGKDALVISGGDITVAAGGDGLKADEAEDAALGYIVISDGRISVDAGGDAISAETAVQISGGDFALTSGGGSAATLAADASAKAIKAGVSVVIDGGAFVIDAADDGVHANGQIEINGGTFTIATADDGMHADETLTVNGGTLDVTRSYEGLESAVITINGGDVHVVASDDGINIAGGNDASGFGPGGPGGPGGGRPAGPGAQPGAAAQDAFATASDQVLTINDGYVVVDAGGDALDVNGTIEMTGGVVILFGPTEQMNGAVDYDGGFTISGGLLVGTGSAGMAQAPSVSSSQHSLLVYLGGTLEAGNLLNISSESDEELLTAVSSKPIQSLVFSSPDLLSGQTYTISYGGTHSGTLVDGVYSDGSYTPGSALGSFTVSGTVTTVGNRTR